MDIDIEMDGYVHIYIHISVCVYACVYRHRYYGLMHKTNRLHMGKKINSEFEDKSEKIVQNVSQRE